MDFFLDDRKIMTYTRGPATGWAFDRPMYLIMNIASGGPDEPAPDDSILPQYMTVDYVRVYQRDLQNSGVRGQGSGIRNAGMNVAAHTSLHTTPR